MQLPQHISPGLFLAGTVDGWCSFLAGLAPASRQTQGPGEQLIIRNSQSMNCGNANFPLAICHWDLAFHGGYAPTAQLAGLVDTLPFSWQHQSMLVVLFVMWAPALQRPGRDLVPCAMLPASTRPVMVTVGYYAPDFFCTGDPEVTPSLSHSNSHRRWFC